MTLILDKYQYPKLTRAEVNGNRRYQTPEGSKVPSVTTILSATKPEKDKAGLQKWRDRVGEKTAKAVTTEAANRGTRMHKYLEDFIEFGEWPVPGSNPYSKQAHKMATVIRENAMCDVDEIWGSEVSLYVPKIYAGTTDLVGQYKTKPAIMDFKQSNKFKKEEYVQDYYLQMAAYGTAHNDVYGTNIREGHVFMCTIDLVYQQFSITPDKWDYWANEWWKRVEQFYVENS
jgi:hypothetical protein